MEKSTATLSRKIVGKTQKSHSDVGIAGQESMAVIRRKRRQERHGRSRSSKKSTNNAAVKQMPIKTTETKSSCCRSSSVEEDEKGEEVEDKIIALQRIVPGGESLGVDKLFEETAGYILELQYQVKALKFLASFVEGSEKEKRKLGG